MFCGFINMQLLKFFPKLKAEGLHSFTASIKYIVCPTLFPIACRPATKNDHQNGQAVVLLSYWAMIRLPRTVCQTFNTNLELSTDRRDDIRHLKIYKQKEVWIENDTSLRLQEKTNQPLPLQLNLEGSYELRTDQIIQFPSICVRCDLHLKNTFKIHNLTLCFT